MSGTELAARVARHAIPRCPNQGRSDGSPSAKCTALTNMVRRSHVHCDAGAAPRHSVIEFGRLAFDASAASHSNIAQQRSVAEALDTRRWSRGAVSARMHPGKAPPTINSTKCTEFWGKHAKPRNTAGERLPEGPRLRWALSLDQSPIASQTLPQVPGGDIAWYSASGAQVGSSLPSHSARRCCRWVEGWESWREMKTSGRRSADRAASVVLPCGQDLAAAPSAHGQA